MPFVAKVFGKQTAWVFQHENASTHTSNFAGMWLTEHFIWTLPSPASFPKINITENVWGLLARRVYYKGRQFDEFALLEAFVRKEWSEIEPDYLLKLYESLKRRSVAVLNAKGGETRYKSRVHLTKLFSNSNEICKVWADEFG